MAEDERWKQRFENFCKALIQLETALQQKKNFFAGKRRRY